MSIHPKKNSWPTYLIFKFNVTGNRDIIFVGLRPTEIMFPVTLNFKIG